jgi:hypothetical protein
MKNSLIDAEINGYQNPKPVTCIGIAKCYIFEHVVVLN